jgi:hypothetical protein
LFAGNADLRSAFASVTVGWARNQRKMPGTMPPAN